MSNSTVHELKTWTDGFQAVWDGKKTAEVRKLDRGFQEGDKLYLLEWDPIDGYSGRGIVAEIIGIYCGIPLVGDFGLLSLRVIRKIDKPDLSECPEFAWTGEYRPPKDKDWFLSLCSSIPIQAKGNFEENLPRFILRKIEPEAEEGTGSELRDAVKRLVSRANQTDFRLMGRENFLNLTVKAGDLREVISALAKEAGG